MLLRSLRKDTQKKHARKETRDAAAHLCSLRQINSTHVASTESSIALRLIDRMALCHDGIIQQYCNKNSSISMANPQKGKAGRAPPERWWGANLPFYGR